ncbi:MAG: serine hydrolase [Akkermansia sp.]
MKYFLPFVLGLMLTGITSGSENSRLPQAYITAQPARVGVALLENGQLHTLGEGEFPLMSVVKLHQACYVLHCMEERGLHPEDTLLIHYSELRQDTYSPMLREHRDSVFRLSLRELLAYSLQLSDNNACDLLFRHFGAPVEVQRYMQSLGIDCRIGATEAEMHDTPSRINDNRSTPASVASLMSRIAEHRLGLTPAYADLLDELLSGCKTGTSRIAAGLPPGATLLHKTGTGPCTTTHTCGVNDAAYITLPNGRRYALVILCSTSALPLPQTEALLAEISARIAAE